MPVKIEIEVTLQQADEIFGAFTKTVISINEHNKCTNITIKSIYWKRVSEYFISFLRGFLTPPQQSFSVMALVLDNPAFEGLVTFVSKKNLRNRNFVPSSQNYIAHPDFNQPDIAQQCCMVDDGCNSVLFCLEDVTTVTHVLLPAFPPTHYHWKIKTGKGVGAVSICLELTPRAADTFFRLVLGEDMGGGDILLEKIRFHLCSEDIVELHARANQRAPNFSLRNAFDHHSRLLLADRLNKGEVPRRTHALIGQTVLGHHKSYDDGQFRYFLRNETTDPADAEHLTPTLLANIVNGTTSQLLTAQQVVQLEPDDFEDLEYDEPNPGDEEPEDDIESGDEE